VTIKSVPAARGWYSWFPCSLNYSSLESGKLALQLRGNDLRDCLDQIVGRLSESFQRKGVKLETLIDPSIATFRFEYQKVQQAAENLLDNALKHTPSEVP
jgi:signal transduction histidine kinase